MYTCLSLLCLVPQLLGPAGASHGGIIGGNVSKPHSSPYMASLQINGSHYCGGFLVREDFVLTAAHCFIYGYKITVVLGAYNIKMEEKSIQKIPVKKQYRHPINTKDKYDFDIMLIKLQRNATLNKMVSLVQLPDKKETVPDETKCLASGWGMTTPGGSPSDVLRAVTLSIESGKQCKKIWGRYFEPQRKICTYFDGTNGICQGDSGGPLICNKKAHGIVSFTGTPCDKKKPSVYVKISYFIPWIKQTMRG